MIDLLHEDRQDENALDFEFRGNAREWFGIWIVNLLLSIITFGIYSAWAKVRMRKYFYQHTYIAGRNFDYHATGKQILIGRLIVIVGLVLYSWLSSIPAFAVIMPFVLIAVIPWLLVRALRFNSIMTSWSNVRFGFDGKTGKAFLVYALYPILTVFTLYLTLPFADRAQRRYLVRNHRLGTAGFYFNSGIGGFYKAFFASLAWIVLCGAVLAAIFYNEFNKFSYNRSLSPEEVTTLVIGFYIFLFVGFIPAGAIYRAFIRNTVFNGTILDNKHRLVSDINPIRYTWILFSNAIVTIVSLGLLLPWAKIREAKYNAEHTRLISGGSLDEFVGDLEAKASALGDAYTDIDGFDVGLPI